jgi:hypothetical protein
LLRGGIATCLAWHVYSAVRGFEVDFRMQAVSVWTRRYGEVGGHHADEPVRRELLWAG